MREPGIPKVLTWRWAPFAGLVLGALSFAVFALLAIPEHIGKLDSEEAWAPIGFGSQLAGGRVRLGSTRPAPRSDSSMNPIGPSDTMERAAPVRRVASQPSDVFPKRGFSPPLERPEPAEVDPPPAVPPSGSVVAPAPAPAASSQPDAAAPQQAVLDPGALQAPGGAADPAPR